MSHAAESSVPSSKKAKPNPYSMRGLDKFSKVLTELGAKKEKIMARAGSQGVAMVRFVYDNTKDWVPIIVRPKREAEEKKPSPMPMPAPPAEEELKEAREERRVPKRSMGWKGDYYWPLAAVVVLLSLLMFGRVFAICGSCLLWYMTPTLKDWIGKNAIKSMKKKEYGRIADERLNDGNTMVK